MGNVSYLKRLHCIHCGKLKESSSKVCTCGSRAYSLKSNYVRSDEGISCICDDSRLSMYQHIDAKNSCTYSYKCTNCDNKISVAVLRG